MRITNAMPGIGPLTEAEVDNFLGSKLNVQLATVDEAGDANIQPTWFYYDRGDKKLYVMTRKATRKIRNIRRRPGVYFSIDDENFPYRGVKGKGTAAISEDPRKVVPVVEKISLKYLGTLDHPIAKMNIEAARNGDEVLLEISPKFFSTWDFGKMQ
jgi:PPOX class probable F420-dependent enzyme